MFQFGRFPLYTYLFSIQCTDLTPCGLLHSDICGSYRACQSPQLFAAYRVLLRLLMPRHPPCALISLTYSRIMSLFLNRRIFEIVSTHKFLYWFPNFLFVVSLFNFQGSSFALLTSSVRGTVYYGGHKWTRTIDLTLIRRAL